MAVTEEMSRGRRLWLWFAPLIIAVAVIVWSFYWSYMDEREREAQYASPLEQR
jgi:hypothetical protein